MATIGRLLTRQSHKFLMMEAGRRLPQRCGLHLLHAWRWFCYGFAALIANMRQCAVHSSTVHSLPRPASPSCRVSRWLLPGARNYSVTS